jgi:hypothetical protein
MPPRKIDPKVFPTERISEMPRSSAGILELKDKLNIFKPEFSFEMIPIIRKLVKLNPNLGQALDNIVQLGNTGHDIVFDSGVSVKEVDNMNRWLNDRKHTWCEGQAGMDGVVNRMISQLMISGATATEWVPRRDLKGIHSIVFINPETIRWGFDRRSQKWIPYQKVENSLNKELIKLNPLTFRYYALNGDEDTPYGFPPYLAALEAVSMQMTMLDNIKFIVGQLGLLGFLHALIQKPEQQANESISAYTQRLEKFLTETRDSLAKGFRQGILVGYKDDTEFDFHSTTRNLDGMSELYQLNELNFASGAKMDAAMWGRGYATSETQINVVFSKLLAQLKNIQNILKANLEFGYTLELRMAGYNFNNLTVVFNPSTAVDKLKEQQAEEYKLRNSLILYYSGIISLDEFARRHGYEAPDQKDIRYLVNNPITPEEAAEKRRNQKSKSASDTRDKRKRKSSTKQSGDLAELLMLLYEPKESIKQKLSKFTSDAVDVY